MIPVLSRANGTGVCTSVGLVSSSFYTIWVSIMRISHFFLHVSCYQHVSEFIHQTMGAPVLEMGYDSLKMKTSSSLEMHNKYTWYLASYKALQLSESHLIIKILSHEDNFDVLLQLLVLWERCLWHFNMDLRQ